MESAHIAALLEKVAQGIMTPAEAQAELESTMEGRPKKLEVASVKEGFQSALDKLRRNVQERLEEKLERFEEKFERFEERLERFQENVTTNFHAVSFVSPAAGIDGTLSVFRGLTKDETSTLTRNTVVGSQWFGVELRTHGLLKGNKFTATQLSGVEVLSSQVLNNHWSVLRLAQSRFEGSALVGVKITRGVFSDVELSHSRWEQSCFLRSDLAQVAVTASQWIDCVFEDTTFKDCDFQGCVWDSVTFDQCSFSDCSFLNVKLTGKGLSPFKGHKVVGLHCEGELTCDDFAKLLQAHTAN
jgi:uncharacterized protein YjbI with pentapeptide repeats